MLSVLVALVAVYLLAEPLLVGLHELGHAVAPLARGHETVAFVGGEVGHTVTVGQLTVTVAPRGFLAPVTYGATATDAAATRGTVAAGALGGPVVSLALLVGVGWALVDAPTGLARGIGGLIVAYLWFQTVFTLLPLRYPGWAGAYGDYRSDGMIVLDVLRGRDRAEE